MYLMCEIKSILDYVPLLEFSCKVAAHKRGLSNTTIPNQEEFKLGLLHSSLLLKAKVGDH